MRSVVRWTTVWLSVCAAGVWAAEPESAAEAFRKYAAAKAVELRSAETMAFEGRDGFFFLTSELRHYSTGPFWGESAASVSRADKHQDPLPAILGFHAQLKKAGILLIFVPVPGKAAIYADKLDAKLAVEGRLDTAHQVFYELLRKEGVEVVDLLPEFIEMRKKGTDSHCRQDTHWTPAAVKLAASRIAALVRAQPWYAQVAEKKTAEREEELVETNGDLVQMLKRAEVAPEDVKVERIRWGGKSIESDARSPLLLLGDSHALVYHMEIPGGIPARDGGLFDRLAAELGIAPDLVANMGSGANPPRITLARRKDNLAGKKCVVWCLSVRELTESPSGWMPIPVIR